LGLTMLKERSSLDLPSGSRREDAAGKDNVLKSTAGERTFPGGYCVRRSPFSWGSPQAPRSAALRAVSRMIDELACCSAPPSDCGSASYFVRAPCLIPAADESAGSLVMARGLAIARLPRTGHTGSSSQGHPLVVLGAPRLRELANPPLTRFARSADFCHQLFLPKKWVFGL
jgi:hypothetical protein